MIAPSVVIFDLGKVLVDFDYAIAAQRIAAHGTMTLRAIGEYINQSRLFVQYESGTVTTAAILRRDLSRHRLPRHPGRVRRLLRRHLRSD